MVAVPELQLHFATPPVSPSNTVRMNMTHQSTTVEETGLGSSISRKSTPTPSEPLSAAMQRFAIRPLRRSSSRIQRWVQDQQKRHSSGDSTESYSAYDDNSETESPSSTSQCNPWLAYPHLRVSTVATERDDLSTVGESYVFVDEAEEGSNGAGHGTVDAVTQHGLQQVIDLSSSPATPRKQRQATISFTPPSPLRNFARSLSGSRRFSNSGTPTTREQSPTRTSSIFYRQNRASTHSRASSIATTLFSQRQAREVPADATTIASSPSGSTWRLRRPSVMGHFPSSLDIPRSEEIPRLPRPSTSSSMTRSSETIHTRTSIDTSSGHTQQKYSNYGTLRPHTPSTFFHPTPSLWSLPADASHLNDPPGSTKMIADDRGRAGTVRIPLALKGSSNTSSHGASILHPPKSKKKRKLVVSGIPPGDQRRYDHVRLWCESFGELNQITRMSNGDLHVDFRKTEVADTVCRLHARVHISGVGSVGLSWFTGKRP